MQRLIARLIDSPNPEALQTALSWLYSFVRPHWLAIIGLLGLSICASLLVLVQPWLIKLLIDDGLLGRDFSMVVQIAGLMILAGLLGTALSGVNRYLHTRLSGRILFSLRDDLYRHLQTLSPSFYGQRRIGDLMSRLDGDVAEIQRFAVDSLFSAVSSVIGLICAVVMLLTLSWKLALLVLVLIPLDVIWLRWMRRKVERDVRQLRERSADLSSFMVETLPVMKFIQSAGQQRRESTRLELLGQGYMSQLLRLQVTEFFTQAVPGTLTSLSRACAFLIGGYWVVQGTWQLGALIAFSTYLGMAVGPVQSLLGLYVAIQRMTVSLGRVMELRGEVPAVLTPLNPQPIPTDGDLRFDAVHFTHPGRRSTLCGIDARIPYGLKVALSGGSGVGKSTLIDLLQRHHDPQSGRVLLGEVDLREFDLLELRRRIAVVSQDIVLFRGSLADNLAYAVAGASREAIAEVARLAQLDSLIASLPEGLDSPLGERGQQLSGGRNSASLLPERCCRTL